MAYGCENTLRCKNSRKCSVSHWSLYVVVSVLGSESICTVGRERKFKHRLLGRSSARSPPTADGYRTHAQCEHGACDTSKRPTQGALRIGGAGAGGGCTKSARAQRSRSNVRACVGRTDRHVRHVCTRAASPDVPPGSRRLRGTLSLRRADARPPVSCSACY